jgi:hypothetical protein
MEVVDREIVLRRVSLDNGMSHLFVALGTGILRVKNKGHNEFLSREAI